MKKFVLLYTGTRDQAPTDESIAAWGEWFASIGDKLVDAGNPFGQGREVSTGNTTELSPSATGVTGYTLINAQDIDEAEKVALAHPTVESILVYEAMPM